MRSHSSSGSYESEQAMRYVWLARGLRAVAAALVVGGIVLAAFDGDVPSLRISPFEAPTGQRAPGTTAPNATPPASGAAGAAESDLNRVDRAMEYQG